MNKRELYESIMRNVSREVKKALNEAASANMRYKIDNIKVDLNSFYVDLYDEDSWFSDDYDMVKWSADLKKGRININGKPFMIDGGSISGWLHIDEINEIFHNDINEYNNIQEDYSKEEVIKVLKTIYKDLNNFEFPQSEIVFDDEDNDNIMIGSEDDDMPNTGIESAVYFIHLYGDKIADQFA